MKRTITINILGIVFHIEEDAYQKLKIYLLQVNQKFKNETDGEKSIFDIETRIANYFQSQSNLSVITIDMVNETIEIIGIPVDFETHNFNEPSFYAQPTPPYSSPKRLFRDKNSQVLGGVCSGLGNYFNIDKLLVRIIFIVLFFSTWGVASLAYLILWIATPKVQTFQYNNEFQNS